MEADGQFLQIYRVFPSNVEEMNGERKEVDQSLSINVRRYRRYNDCDVFMYEKPVKKGKSGSEVADLWVEQTYFVTVMPLPNISRFATIRQTSVRELSPLDLAIKTMKDKNQDIDDMIRLFESDKRPEDAQPFISLVQGTVDAAVGGGMKVYQDVFFSDKYGEWDQQQAEEINVLFEEQVDLLQQGLDLWPKICPDSFNPLLEHLLQQFESLKNCN